MGITVALEDENGVRVEALEDTTLLLRAIQSVDGDTLQWMSTIDPYGDTTFNRPQAPRVRSELQRLIGSSADPETSAFLRRVDALLERCESGVHLYVKFHGD